MILNQIGTKTKSPSLQWEHILCLHIFVGYSKVKSKKNKTSLFTSYKLMQWQIIICIADQKI